MLGKEEVIMSVDDVGTVLVYYTRNLQMAFIFCNLPISTWGIAIHHSYKLAWSDNSWTVYIKHVDFLCTTGPNFSTKQLRGHNHNIPSVEYLKDGSNLLSCSIDGTCRLWDVNTGEQLMVYSYGVSWKWKVLSLSLSDFFYVHADDEIWQNLQSDDSITELFGLEPDLLFTETLMNRAYSTSPARVRAGADAQKIRDKETILDVDRGYETGSSLASWEDSDAEDEHPLASSAEPEPLGMAPDPSEHIVFTIAESDATNSEPEDQALYVVYDDTMPNSEHDSDSEDGWDTSSRRIAQMIAEIPKEDELFVCGSQSDLLLWDVSASSPLLYFPAVDGVAESYTARTGMERVSFIEFLPEIGTLIVASQAGRIVVFRLIRSDTHIGMIVDHVIYSNDGSPLLGMTCIKLDTTFSAYQLQILNRRCFIQTYHITSAEVDPL
jgi:WD40 repeat protein